MTNKLTKLIHIWRSCVDLSKDEAQKQFLENWLTENIKHFLYINPDESRADTKTLNKLRNKFSDLENSADQSKGYITL